MGVGWSSITTPPSTPSLLYRKPWRRRRVCRYSAWGAWRISMTASWPRYVGEVSWRLHWNLSRRSTKNFRSFWRRGQCARTILAVSCVRLTTLSVFNRRVCNDQCAFLCCKRGAAWHSEGIRLSGKIAVSGRNVWRNQNNYFWLSLIPS